jgi:hypothetical protein
MWNAFHLSIVFQDVVQMEGERVKTATEEEGDLHRDNWVQLSNI